MFEGRLPLELPLFIATRRLYQGAVDLDWIKAPEAPADSPSAKARVFLRYEDITQDGRLLLEVLPNAIGASVWEMQLEKDPFVRECMRRGIVPMLSRFVLEGEPGPFSVMKPLECEGRYALARALNEAGEVERIIVNMWAELRGPIGRTRPPRPDDAGTIAPAGRVFAEHVFTRPFGPPAQRRVTSLDDVPGAPTSLPRYVLRPFERMLDLPAGATALDDLGAEGEPAIFGVMHTDSNQHVNSLVYLRLFEEAALRRFAALGKREPVLSRKLEIAYRKPCFAGERVRVEIRSFELGGQLGVVGQLVPETQGSPHCAVRVLFG